MDKLKKNIPYFQQLFAAFTVSLGAVPDGIHYAWLSPSMPKFVEESHLYDKKQPLFYLLDCSYFIGALCGFPFFLYFSYRTNRDQLIANGAILMFLSWILFLMGSPDPEYVYMYYAARFVAGLSSCINFISIPMYIGEIAQEKIRGVLLALISIMISIGVLIVYVAAPLVDPRIIAYIGISFPIAQLVLLQLVPSSPYYLLLNKEDDKARDALKQLRGYATDIADELKSMKEIVNAEFAEPIKYGELFSVSSNRQALIILVVLNAAKQFSAKTVILMHCHTILENLSELITNYEAGVAFGVVMLLSGVLGASLLDQLGRNVCLVLSSLFTAGTIWVVALYFSVSKMEAVPSHHSWLPAFCFIIYAMMFKLGLGVVPYVLTGEIFSLRAKNLGMAIAGICDALFGIMSLLMHHAVVKYYGVSTSFYIFGLCCLGVAIFSGKYIPDTKGKTLFEVKKGNRRRDQL